MDINRAIVMFLFMFMTILWTLNYKAVTLQIHWSKYQFNRKSPSNYPSRQQLCAWTINKNCFISPWGHTLAWIKTRSHLWSKFSVLYIHKWSCTYVLIRTDFWCSVSKCCRSFMVKMQCDRLDRLFKPVAATLKLCCPYNITW